MRRVLLLVALLCVLAIPAVALGFTAGDKVKVFTTGEVVGTLSDGRNVVQTDGGVLLLPDSALEAVATPTPEPTPTPSPEPAPAPAPDTAFYVAPFGSDTAAGTSIAPWRTLQYAFGKLNPGDTLKVRGGTYAADLTYERVGTQANPITVEAFPGEQPILESVTREPLRVRGNAAWTTFRGLTIQHAAKGSNYQNVYVLGSANHITFERNVIRWALEGSGAFVDNTVNHIDFLGNLIYENNGANQHQGLYHEGQDSVIAGNVVYGHTNGFGIQVKTGANNVTVSQNTTADNKYSGIVIMDTATNTKVVNNVSAFNGDYGIRGFDDSPGGTAGTNTSWGNLLYGNGAGPCANQYAGIIACGAQFPAADPLFVNRALRDYRLQPSSPALGKADAGYVYSPDAAGRDRPLPASVGAFEGN